MKHSIILWVQSPEANNQSILSSNGKLIPLDSEEFQQRFNEVVVHDKYKRLVATDDSSVFQAKTKNELISYIVYSNYKEEDVVGRKIGYMARVDMPQSAGLQHVKEAKYDIFLYVGLISSGMGLGIGNVVPLYSVRN